MSFYASIVGPSLTCCSFQSSNGGFQPVSAEREIAPGILSCGTKHDNLVFTIGVLGEESSPPFVGFTDAQIVALLSLKSRELWRLACEMGKSKIHSWEMRELLEKLVLSVQADILDAELQPSERQIAALANWKGKVLIVRSSSDEDRPESVNSGGNISVGGVGANWKDVQIAMSQVIPSFFSYLSLKNRCATEDPFARLPLAVF